MLRKICPCLSWLSSDSSSGRQGYNPQQLEQEEFMHQIQSQGKRYSDSNKLMDDDITPIQQRLNHELGLNNSKTGSKNDRQGNEHIESYFKETSIVKDADSPRGDNQEENNQDLIELGGNDRKEEEEEKGFGELQINIPEYDENFNLLKEAAFDSERMLDTTTDCVQISLNSLNAKSAGSKGKLKINKSKLRAWRKSQSVSSFVMQWVLPCSFSFYSELTNKKISPKDNNKFIKEFRLLESLHPNLTAKYICFNKLGMLESRDFTYLKYTNNSKISDTGHWQLCVSKDMQQKNEHNAKPGRIHSLSYIKEGSANGQIFVRVKTYVNVDIGTNLQKIWDKIFLEVRAYIEGLWEEAAENYEEELV